ncbi:uncharacterized protein LOC143914536 [Arctopsyche grandis]|uniref:uncharacterized protein LOC143914536 n=1 Tax=Arctopsyche grandis TaxID=121162 RepID=UPI00406D8ABA
MDSNTVCMLIFMGLLHNGVSLERIFNERITADYLHSIIPKQIVYNNNQILVYSENKTCAMTDINEEPHLVNVPNYKAIKSFLDDKGNEVNLYGNAAFLRIKGKAYYKIITQESYSIYKMDYDSKKKLIYTLSGPPGDEKVGGTLYFFDLQNVSICNEKVITYALGVTDDEESKILTFAVDKITGDMILYSNDNKITSAKDNSIYTPFASTSNCRTAVNQTKSCDFASSSEIVDKIVNLHDRDSNVTATKLINDYRLLRVQYQTLSKRFNAMSTRIGQPQNITIPPEPVMTINSTNFRGTLQALLQESQSTPVSGRSKCDALEQSVKALESKLDLTRSRLLLSTQSRFSENDETEGDTLQGLISPRKAADSDDTIDTYVCMEKSVLKDFRKSISNLIRFKNNPR